MKKLSFKAIFLLMGLAVIFLPACEDPNNPGPRGGGTTDAPFVSGTTDIITLSPQDTFTVTLDATSGDGDLNALTIYEDGFQLDPSRIAIAGISVANNPQVITAADAGGFTWDISIIAHSDVAAVTYEFEVTDVNQLTDAYSVEIVTEEEEDVFVSTGPINVGFPNANPGGSIQVTGGNLIKMDLDIDTGDSPLKEIAVTENGTLISDLSRLRYRDTPNEFTSNPQPFLGDDVNGFVGSIFIQAADGVNEIGIGVTNEAGEIASSTITFDAGPTGTPATTISGVLLNSAGPAGTGGLDLDTGLGTGSTDAAAEIRDQGIDTNQPVSANWIRKISTVNGAQLRLPDYNALPDGFNFTNVTTVEQINGVYDTGIPMAQSDVVQVGDIFVVRGANGKDYLLLTTNVGETTSDNDDFYEFSIKQ